MIEHGQEAAINEASTKSRKRRILNWLSIACAGSALICDGYQNSLMTAINLVFKQEYPKEYDSGYTTRMSNAMTVGQIIGMLVVGLTCDLISRKRAIILTTLCMLIGSILATAAHGATTHGMFWMIIVMRGMTGFGVGGEFPTSSAITLEAASDNERLAKKSVEQQQENGGAVTSSHLGTRRGPLFTLIINVPLQLGGPLNMSIFLIVWEACGGQGKHLSTVWRVMFGIGCVWPVLVFAMRIRLVTSQIFRNGKFLNYNIPWLLAFRFYWKRLLGTCITFFLYDMIVFPNGIFSSLILKSVVKGGDTKKTAEWNLLLGALTLPGVFLGAFLCDRLGRKQTLLLGFAGFVVFGIVIGVAFDHLKKIVPLFVVFYGLFQAVGHMGPGSMIGLITSESYATGVRATFYGLSLAFGRAGGAVGTQVFNPIKEHWGQRWTFLFSAAIGGCAIIWAWLFLPHLDGRELSEEDDRFLHYLRSHGFESQIGYIEQVSPSSSSSLSFMHPDDEIAAVDGKLNQQRTRTEKHYNIILNGVIESGVKSGSDALTEKGDELKTRHSVVESPNADDDDYGGGNSRISRSDRGQNAGRMQPSYHQPEYVQPRNAQPRNVQPRTMQPRTMHMGGVVAAKNDRGYGRPENGSRAVWDRLCSLDPLSI